MNSRMIFSTLWALLLVSFGALAFMAYYAAPQWASTQAAGSHSMLAQTVPPQTTPPKTTAPAAGELPLCSGEPEPDVPVDVTKQMSMVGPSVVAVYQLTGLDSHGKVITAGGGRVVDNYLTNSDMTVYSGETNPPVFIVNTQQPGGAYVKTIRVDHRGAQLSSTKGGNHVRVSVDGLAVAQAWRLGGGADILFTSLAGRGRCETKFITHYHIPPAQGAGVSGIPTTNPSWDSAKNLYHVCYAPGGGSSPDPGKIYCAYSDGSQSYPPFQPKDACQGFVYHKSRMDYQFPYLIAMQREDKIGPRGTLCSELIDVRTGTVVADLGDGRNGRSFYNHDDWATNGLELIAQGPHNTGGTIHMRVLDSTGKVFEGFNQPKSEANPHGFTYLNLKTRVRAEWCSFAPNHLALCTSPLGKMRGAPPPERPQQAWRRRQPPSRNELPQQRNEPEAQGNEPPLEQRHQPWNQRNVPQGNRPPDVFPVQVPPECGPAFSVDIETEAIKFITCTDGWTTRRYEGQAVIRYAYTDANGNAHALFRSDKSGEPQVYEVVFKP